MRLKVLWTIAGLGLCLLTASVAAQPGLPTHTNSLGMKFALIPAGSFMMGSPENEPGREPAEGPRHQVEITRPFYLQTTEVTQAQWKAVMGDNPAMCTGRPDRPVSQVSWEMAQEFIQRLNQREGTGKYRLPTEAEWEYACRAGTDTPYAFGPTITPDQAAYSDPARTESRVICTTPVAGHKPNAWGLYDMHGNVWEWCSDWFGEGYYAASPAKDPAGPAMGSRRVCRGGSVTDGPEHLRSATRGSGDPAFRRYVAGLRVARDI